uniref:(northern house mosquito) hypothetical protein n=1 Tax=Culex pipiens TaxID=7175 RepID=A0A8D8HYL8_CULPI
MWPRSRPRLQIGPKTGRVQPADRPAALPDVPRVGPSLPGVRRAPNRTVPRTLGSHLEGINRSYRRTHQPAVVVQRSHPPLLPRREESTRHRGVHAGLVQLAQQKQPELRAGADFPLGAHDRTLPDAGGEHHHQHLPGRGDRAGAEFDPAARKLRQPVADIFARRPARVQEVGEVSLKVEYLF